MDLLLGGRAALVTDASSGIRGEAGYFSRHWDMLKGADTADSWATDGHMWLNVSFDCGYAFIADPEAHRASMSIHAPYITENSTRRALGFPTLFGPTTWRAMRVSVLIWPTSDDDVSRAIAAVASALPC